MARKASEKKTCLRCANEYAVSSFYSHRNSIINEQFGICKKCTKEFVELDDLSTLENFLRTMDIPYVREFWVQANNATTETVGTYLKNMNSLRQNKELRFKDGDEITGKTNEAETLEDEYEDFVVTRAMIKQWGRSLEKEDYAFLEEEFEKLGGYEAEDTIQQSILRNMSRTQWMANKALEDGDHGKYEKMMKTLSSQMQDANIKPVQIKSASEDGVKSWSEWVRLIEETEPINEVAEDFKDVDGIYKYIERWFIVQLQRVFGRIKDEDIKKLDGES